jgi:DNA repair exonuclease SbcCD ATPase subunit
LAAEKAVLARQVSEAKAQLAEAQGRGDAIKNDESRAAYLRNEIQQQQGKLAELQVAIGAAEERSAAAKREQADLATLAARKVQLEADVAGLRAEEARLGSVENTRRDMEAKLASTRTELGGIEERLAAAKLAAQSAEVLAGQKIALEGDVSRLKAEVARLEERSQALVRTNAQVDAAAQSAEKLKAAYDALSKVLAEINTKLAPPSPKPDSPPDGKKTPGDQGADGKGGQ